MTRRPDSDRDAVPFEASSSGNRRRTLRSRAIALPIALASSVAVALGIAQPAQAVPQQPQEPQQKPESKPRAGEGSGAVGSVVESVPAEVTVADGDTVSGIAERFGLSTAELLAANGLGWSSLVFPGQRLVLPGGGAPVAPAPPAAPEIARHTVVSGETISGIAAQYGLDVDQLLSANGLGRDSLIFPGQAVVLPIPGTTAAAAEAPPQEMPEAPSAQPPAPAPDPDPGGESYTVVAGDTAWDIAVHLSIDLDALLAANGLGPDAVLQPGQVLTVVRPAKVALVASVDVVLTEEMRQNAQLIVDVGRALGVPDRGIVIALAAAAQESGLRNVRHGDRDSLGLFQQRPSQGWGTPEQTLDPVRATTAFYGGAANPNPGVTAGLLDIAGWQELSVTEAAQAVQRSAYPDHYAKWQAAAEGWLSELG